jgi:predicted AAA+ superfamily ATPase
MGFYPRLYKDSENHLSPREYYLNYIQTYIERDVRQIQNISDLSTFQKFVGLCAERIGQFCDQAEKITTIEIKSSKTISTDYYSGLNYWNKLANGSLNNS